MMRYRRVYVDVSLVAAVLDPDDPGHEAAAAVFAGLLHEYERGATQLFTSRSAMAAGERSRDVLRVAMLVPVRRDVRRLARRTTERHPDVDPARAEVLAIMQRHQITEIATADAWYAGVGDLGVVSAPTR